MPSRHYAAQAQVDEVLRQMEVDERRQQEAIDAFYRRENAKPVVSWKLALIGIFIGGCLAAIGAWWLITQALDRFTP